MWELEGEAVHIVVSRKQGVSQSQAQEMVVKNLLLITPLANQAYLLKVPQLLQ